jgi:hypothetical protein
MKVGAESTKDERKENRYWDWKIEWKKSSHIGNGPNCLAWYNFCLFWWIKNIWWQVNYIHMSWKFLLSGNLTVYWPFTPYPSLCSFLESTYLTLFNLVKLHRFLFRKYMYTVQYHDKKYKWGSFWNIIYIESHNFSMLQPFRPFRTELLSLKIKDFVK